LDLINNNNNNNIFLLFKIIFVFELKGAALSEKKSVRDLAAGLNRLGGKN